MYECMYDYVCTLWKGVPYHLWAKNLASGGPPPTSFRSPKNMWGGGIFHVVRWNISQKFLALPPPKYSRVKGGGMLISSPSSQELLNSQFQKWSKQWGNHQKTHLFRWEKYGKITVEPVRPARDVWAPLQPCGHELLVQHWPVGDGVMGQLLTSKRWVENRKNMVVLLTFEWWLCQ